MQSRRFALLSGTFAGVLIAGALVASLDWLRVEWYLARLQSDDPGNRESARRGLTSLAPARAVPVLLERTSAPQPLDGPADLECVREILARLDLERLDHLARELEPRDVALQLRCLVLHHEAAPDDSHRARLLAAILRSREAGLRRFAAEQLSRLRRVDPQVLDALRRARNDESEEVRFWVKLALENHQSS